MIEAGNLPHEHCHSRQASQENQPEGNSCQPFHHSTSSCRINRITNRSSLNKKTGITTKPIIAEPAKTDAIKPHRDSGHATNALTSQAISET